MGALIATLLPVVIPQVVKLVEKMFGHKTGAQKKSTVLEMLEALIKKTGDLAGPSVGLPQRGELDQIIEQVVSALNERGELQGHDTQIQADVPAILAGAATMFEGAARVLKAVR